ncbi:MAG TPA: hypothetical protein VM344_07380, partial [Vitreimonas sp.]|nr:hypothetical protein [Vitreimonas sp.]
LAATLGSDVPLFLARGPVLIEGRGERVSPLAGITGDGPGVLLVTPAVPVSTGDVFAIVAAVGRPSGSTRLSSEHLAQELRSGLASTGLVARAGVLASANDLLGASAVLVPALTPFRRTLMRRLGRPVGQSGSGPTLWALYPSQAQAQAAADELDRAVDSGELTAVGDGRPFITATTIAPTERRNP